MKVLLTVLVFSSAVAAQVPPQEPATVRLLGGETYNIKCSCGTVVGEATGAANGAAFDYADASNGASPSGWPDDDFSGGVVGTSNAYEFVSGGKEYVVVFYDDGTWKLTNVTADPDVVTEGTYEPKP